MFSPSIPQFFLPRQKILPTANYHYHSPHTVISQPCNVYSKTFCSFCIWALSRCGSICCITSIMICCFICHSPLLFYQRTTQRQFYRFIIPAVARNLLHNKPISSHDRSHAHYIEPIFCTSLYSAV